MTDYIQTRWTVVMTLIPFTPSGTKFIEELKSKSATDWRLFSELRLFEFKQMSGKNIRMLAI